MALSRLQKLRAAKKSQKLTTASAPRSASLTRRAGIGNSVNLRTASRNASASRRRAPVNFSQNARDAKAQASRAKNAIARSGGNMTSSQKADLFRGGSVGDRKDATRDLRMPKQSYKPVTRGKFANEINIQGRQKSIAEKQQLLGANASQLENKRRADSVGQSLFENSVKGSRIGIAEGARPSTQALDERIANLTKVISGSKKDVPWLNEQLKSVMQQKNKILGDQSALEQATKERAIAGREASGDGVGVPTMATRDYAGLRRSSEPTKPSVQSQPSADPNIQAQRLIMDIASGRKKMEELTDAEMNVLASGGSTGVSPTAEFLRSEQERLAQQAQAMEAQGEQDINDEMLDVKREQSLEREFSGKRDVEQANAQKEAIAERAAAVGGGRGTFVSDRQQEVTNQLNTVLERRREIDSMNRGKMERDLRRQYTAQSFAMDEKIAELGFEAAKEEAKANAANNVDPFTAVKNLMSIMPKEASSQVNWTGSKMLGHMVDNQGNAILDAEGNKQSIGAAPGEVKYEKATIGDNLVYVNPFDPTDYKFIGKSGDSYHEGEDGFVKSAETSDGSGSSIIGQDQRPDWYEKTLTDIDGNKVSLAENCVYFAREMADGVIDSTTGLVTKQNKKDAIASVGEKDPSMFKEGDVVLTGEGSWGHAAVIDSINDDGTMTLTEANKIPGRVTTGRKISMNDPKVYGVLPGNKTLDEDVSFGDDAKEGFNKSVDNTITKDLMTDIISSLSLGGMTDKESERFSSEMKKLVDEGQYGRAKEVAIKAAYASMNGDSQKLYGGNTLLLDMVDEIDQDLQEYEAMGGDTGILSGNIQKMKEKIGKVGDPELARIANKITLGIQKYRQSVSGAAFSESEGIEYKSVFPSSDKVAELNSAKMQALREMAQVQNDSMLAMQFGKRNYETLFGKQDMPDESPRQSSSNTFSLSSKAFDIVRNEDLDIQAALDAGMSIEQIEQQLLTP